MARKFSALVARMSPESRARSDALHRQLLAEMPLQELRRVLDLTQQQVAASFGINPVAVSKMESQTDMHVSTLRRFVEAMGGELRLVARFPQGAVEISQFQRVSEPTEPATPASPVGSGSRTRPAIGQSASRYPPAGGPRAPRRFPDARGVPPRPGPSQDRRGGQARLHQRAPGLRDARSGELGGGGRVRSPAALDGGSNAA